MFKLPRLVTAPLLYRRVSRDLSRIADALDAQTSLLARLADRFAPQFEETTTPAARALIKADTGVSHLDADDAAEAIAFSELMASRTGHIPDEEEVLIHLADEKTQNLQERLAARDGELARLMESRR